MAVERIPAFARADESPDERFYREPRFVTHIDDRAVGAVTELYRERLPPGGHILDLMSSWVSHLPPEVAYASVVGIGMNERELGENPRLAAYLVHDLNLDPALPFDDGVFDAAAICVSIQYLTQPIAVLREAARVCRAGAPLVVTFSNRCFPTKAVAIWQALSDRGHAELIERYLVDAGGWGAIEALDRTPRGGDPLFAIVARRTA
ncbi:MAG: class I SAM-dependent methyltransferase [Vulcanimicrobiaceae bacterium]